MHPTRIEIVEVGPRDGLQNEAAVVPTQAKLAFIAQLVRAGVRRVEAVSFVNPTRVPRMGAAADSAGAHEIALADTIGVGVPADVRRLVGAVREVSTLPLRVHLHNTRNTGYANAVAAIEAGVTALDSSAGGIGGCPFAPK